MIGPIERVHLNTLAVATLAIANVLTTPAFAAGSNMPWEQPLQQILQSIE
jgi:type IV secretion system protein TrbC